jgi:hypothetical protein
MCFGIAPLSDLAVTMRLLQGFSQSGLSASAASLKSDDLFAGTRQQA